LGHRATHPGGAQALAQRLDLALSAWVGWRDSFCHTKLNYSFRPETQVNFGFYGLPVQVGGALPRPSRWATLPPFDAERAGTGSAGGNGVPRRRSFVEIFPIGALRSLVSSGLRRNSSFLSALRG